MIYSTLNEAWNTKPRFKMINKSKKEIVLDDPEIIEYFENISENPNDVIKKFIIPKEHDINLTMNQTNVTKIEGFENKKKDDDDIVVILFLFLLLVLFY